MLAYGAESDRTLGIPGEVSLVKTSDFTLLVYCLLVDCHCQSCHHSEWLFIFSFLNHWRNEQLLIHKFISSTHWLWMSYPSVGFVWHTLRQRICLVVQWAPRLQKPKSWCKGHWYCRNPWPGNFRPFCYSFILVEHFVKNLWPLLPNEFPLCGKKQEAFKTGKTII